VADATTPAVGSANYYLVRGAAPAFCNAGNSWRTLSPAEKNGAGGDRDADLAGAANVCP